MGRVRDTAERLWQGEGETQMSPLAIFAGLEQLPLLGPIPGFILYFFIVWIKFTF